MLFLRKIGHDLCCVCRKMYFCSAKVYSYIMLGTIVNTCTIIAGTLAGAVMNRGIKEKYKEVLYTGLGLACLGIGLNAVVGNFSKSEYPVLFIVALALGGIIGTAIDIDGRFAKLEKR